MAGNYDTLAAIWPEMRRGVPVAPVRVGIDSRTGTVIAGWPHVEQSLSRLFATRFHERVMRYYVGSFVPHLIGKNSVPSTMTKFWWAIATACELWEPCYAVQSVSVRSREGSTYDASTGEGVLTSADDLRKGHVAFQLRGRYMPRGHLGDFTPAGQKTLMVIGQGDGIWRTRSEN